MCGNVCVSAALFYPLLFLYLPCKALCNCKVVKTESQSALRSGNSHNALGLAVDGESLRRLALKSAAAPTCEVIVVRQCVASEQVGITLDRNLTGMLCADQFCAGLAHRE